MQKVKRRDTPGEVALRSALHAMGLRFRVDTEPLAGLRRRADIIFRPSRVCAFVDGCFWHGCDRHGSWPRENAEWWREKIEANRLRDADTDERLRAAGWAVVRVCEKDDPASVAEVVADLVRRRRGTV